MLKIRQSWDRLVFNMGIPILVRRHLYIETAPRVNWQVCRNHGQVYHMIPQIPVDLLPQKQSTTHICAYFMRYTLCYIYSVWAKSGDLELGCFAGFQTYLISPTNYDSFIWLIDTTHASGYLLQEWAIVTPITTCYRIFFCQILTLCGWVALILSSWQGLHWVSFCCPLGNCQCMLTQTK